MKRKKIFSIHLPSLLLLLSVWGCSQGLDLDRSGDLVPKTADEDSTVSRIQVGGAWLHSEAYGAIDSPLVVAIHGGPGSDYRYMLNCKELADDGYRVAFYDQRGSGLSQRFDAESYDLDIMIEELKGVIAHYRVAPSQKVCLFGHSWGGMLAAALVNKYPNEVDGLIVAEPGGFLWEDVMAYVSTSRSYALSGEKINDFLQTDRTISPAKDNQAALDYKWMLFTSSEDPSYVGNAGDGPVGMWRMGAIINMALFEYGNTEGFDVTQNLGSFGKEVLFIYSENNPSYGLAHAEKVSSAFNSVELWMCPDAGHDMIAFSGPWQATRSKMLQYLQTL
jgi:proline iminopeptidase